MARPGGPVRIVLAILAGALGGPFFVGMELVAQILIEGRLEYATDPLFGLAGLALMSVLLGAPIALVAILIVFGPMWMMHHRRGLGPYSFVLLATLAGCIMGVVLTGLTGHLDPLMILLFALATAPTGAIMWWVAYAGRPRQAAL